jgi:hypothetical protein
MARRERLTVNKLYVNDIVPQVYGGAIDITGANLNLGVDDTGYDLKLFGATASSFGLWDASLDKMVFDAADLQLGDSDELRFGDRAAGDWIWKFDGADLTMKPASQLEALNIGVSYTATQRVNVTIKGGLTIGATNAGYGEDVTLHASGSAAYVMLDASANKLIFEGVHAQLNDSEELRFGSLDAGDWVAKFDGADLTLLPASAIEALNIGDSTHVANTTLKGTFTVGVDDTGYDVKLFGATTGASFLWDESDDNVVLTKSQIEFDSYLSAGAFDFANDGSVVLTGTHTATVVGRIKVLLGATPGYIKVEKT